jgi:hypothetical protein
MNQEIINETDKMINAFMDNFFLGYAEKHLTEIEDQSLVANVIISFSQSMLVTLIRPIMLSMPTQKSKLRYAREICEVLNGHIIAMVKGSENINQHKVLN